MNDIDPGSLTPQFSLSIGMPVYNGASMLAGALDNILAQSLPTTEIIISDNGSTDETAEICKHYAAENQNIKYIRQPLTTDATLNFRAVLEQASCRYFMWAAHDDTRDPDFTRNLCQALEEDPAAILAFGDIVQYFDGKPVPLSLDFEHKHRHPADRLRWTANNPLHHLYGVWRTSALKQIDWTHTEWWHDTPLMMAASLLGEFIHVPGVRFHYLYNQHPFVKPGGRWLPIQVMTRAGDIFKLLTSSAKTVGKIGGARLGMLASWLCLLKVLGQSITFLHRRLVPGQPVQGAPGDLDRDSSMSQENQ